MGLLDNLTGDTGHKGGLRQAFEMIKPQLNLSGDQEQKIHEIFKNFREERSEIKSNAGDNVKEQMHDARHNVREQIMGLLNEDQRKILKQKLQDLRN